MATGFEIKGLSNVDAGDQEYVIPPLAFSVVDVPRQIVISVPAFAGAGLPIVIITSSVPVQPDPSVTVTIYVVVADGEATGFEIFVALNPVAGPHEYVVPPDAERVVFPPGHIVTSNPAYAGAAPCTVTTTLSEAVQPLPSVIVTI